ncbi:MAG: toll/interleukin-1 receptor domain-containing protein [Bacteroidota bacterium]
MQHFLFIPTFWNKSFLNNFKLKKHGLNPWIDKINLLPGQNWEDVIFDVLRNSEFAIVFLSKISTRKRGYIQKEFKLALKTLDEIPSDQIYIIPVRIENCKVPKKFQTLHYVDLFTPGSFEKILKVLGTNSTNNMNYRETHSSIKKNEVTSKHINEDPVQIEFWEIVRAELINIYNYGDPKDWSNQMIVQFLDYAERKVIEFCKKDKNKAQCCGMIFKADIPFNISKHYKWQITDPSTFRRIFKYNRGGRISRTKNIFAIFLEYDSASDLLAQNQFFTK